MRITVKDVRRAFIAHRDALEYVGISYDGPLVLTEGEGGGLIAYRLNTRSSRDAGLDHPPVGDDFLGLTASQAYSALCDRTRHIYDTARALKESNVPAAKIATALAEAAPAPGMPDEWVRGCNAAIEHIAAKVGVEPITYTCHAVTP